MFAILSFSSSVINPPFAIAGNSSFIVKSSDSGRISNKSLSCNLFKMSGYSNITLKEYLVNGIKTQKLNEPMPRKNGFLSEACFPELKPVLM